MSLLPQATANDEPPALSVLDRVLIVSGVRRPSLFHDLLFEQNIRKIFRKFETIARVDGLSLFIRPRYPSFFITYCKNYGIDRHPTARELEALFRDPQYFLEFRNDR